VAQVGSTASTIAGITCINVAEKFRRQGFQTLLLNKLSDYAREHGWNVLEGYPFDEGAHEKHGEKVAWPGYTKSFENAGYKRVEAHWLTHEDWPRSIYRLEITA
jgi:GNAT superfamily N-acetyltransferase